MLSQVNSVRIASGLMLAIVNDTLDLGKLEAGRVELEEIEFDLDARLDAVVTMHRASADKRQLKFSLQVGLGLAWLCFHFGAKLQSNVGLA